MSTPIWFRNSIVGSSWKRPGQQRRAADHVAGADDERVARGFSEPSAFRCVAKYSAPPAGTAIACGAPSGSDATPDLDRPGRVRLEMAVEVVERQQLDRRHLRWRGLGGRLRERRRRRDDRERRSSRVPTSICSSAFLFHSPGCHCITTNVIRSIDCRPGTRDVAAPPTEPPARGRRGEPPADRGRSPDGRTRRSRARRRSRAGASQARR